MADFRTNKSWLDRKPKNRPMFLAVVLFLFLLTQPAFEGKPFANLARIIFLSFMVISSALTVLKNRGFFWVICCLGVPFLVFNWLSLAADFGQEANRIVRIVSVVLLATFALLLVAVLLTHIIKAEKVSANTIFRAISGYILIGVAWAAIYEILVHLDSDAIAGQMEPVQWSNYLYFSFITLSTLGYGDITPVSPYARSLAMVESIIGPMYLAILIARLVAMYRPTPKE